MVIRLWLVEYVEIRCLSLWMCRCYGLLVIFVIMWLIEDFMLMVGYRLLLVMWCESRMWLLRMVCVVLVIGFCGLLFLVSMV